MCLILSLSISYPYLIEFHGFAYNIQGDEASNGGCNSFPTGHDFQDNSNICIFITMRIAPFWKCENRSGFQIGCQWEPEWFSQSGSHWVWQPSLWFSWWLSYLVLTRRIPVFGLFENQRTVGLDETLQNFIYKHTIVLENVQMNKKKEKEEFTRCQVSSN